MTFFFTFQFLGGGGGPRPPLDTRLDYTDILDRSSSYLSVITPLPPPLNFGGGGGG